MLRIQSLGLQFTLHNRHPPALSEIVASIILRSMVSMAGQAVDRERKPETPSPKWPFIASYRETAGNICQNIRQNQRGMLNQHKRVHSHPHRTAVPRFQMDLAPRSYRKIREYPVFYYLDTVVSWGSMSVL